jgi:hypothetical protein
MIMEELKLLVGMVTDLPSMALWVIAFFFIYKIAIIGSVYGVIRFVAGSLFDWLRAKKAAPVEYKEIRPMIDGICITSDGTTESLIAQLHRLRGRNLSIKSEYIHRCSVDWLREAIDEKIAKDQANKKAA